MRAKIAMLCFALFILGHPAFALNFSQTVIDASPSILVQIAERNFKLVNKTGVTVNSVVAQASADTSQSVALISTSLTDGSSVDVVVSLSGNNCVFDLTVSLPNSISKKLNSVDLCQTDAILLE